MGNNNEGGGNDLYGVLGVNKDCSESELRHAYKKLVLKWHPNRCLASGNSKTIEEASNKFQCRQSDVNKRFLYDVGLYKSDQDDDQNGMSEFLNEMVSMMSQTKANTNGAASRYEEGKRRKGTKVAVGVVGGRVIESKMINRLIQSLF